MGNLTLSGIKLNQQNLSAINILKLTSILTGTATSIPLNMTLNINVKNPNNSAALLNGLDYIINIDDIEFTSGKLDQSLNVAAGATSVLPLTLGVDLAALIKNNSKDAVLKIAKNLAGISGDMSRITLQLKPTFLIGNTPITSPIYYPVSFSFGGK
jgi:LEA14-like dessication related protein